MITMHILRHFHHQQRGTAATTLHGVAVDIGQWRVEAMKGKITFNKFLQEATGFIGNVVLILRNICSLYGITMRQKLPIVTTLVSFLQ